MHEYYIAFDRAAKDLEAAIAEQERLEKNILALRRTLASIHALCQEQGIDLSDVEKRWAELETSIQSGMTNDIRRIIRASDTALTPVEIRDKLQELGGFEEKNGMAMIHVTLNRLAESKEFQEVLKGGRKAWQRNPAYKLADGAKFSKFYGTR